MISLDDEKVQDIMRLISRLRMQMAVHSIRSQALKDGLNKMSLKEVNALIKKLVRSDELDRSLERRKRLTYHK
jgi:hypothetical protein